MSISLFGHDRFRRAGPTQTRSRPMTDIRTGLGGQGLLFSLTAAATFGTSGSFATALTDAGWTTGAAVTFRITIAALVLTIPALIQLQRHWPTLRAHGPQIWRRSLTAVSAYGLIAVAL